jgi:uncharacterized membrane protein YfcA
MWDTFSHFTLGLQTISVEPAIVAGTIAVLITVTLCIAFLKDTNQNADIGKALVYALTTIIGFYFGAATTSKAPNNSTSPPAVSSGTIK